MKCTRIINGKTKNKKKGEAKIECARIINEIRKKNLHRKPKN
jgi:hypothetical protein